MECRNFAKMDITMVKYLGAVAKPKGRAWNW